MASPDRPTGQIAFLFTDIEGSTRLVEALGTAAWGPVLARHRRIIRAALARYGGHEVGTEGDGFFAVFRDPLAAVRAAADAQRGLAGEPWPSGAAVRVRMGIHAGIGELDPDGGYVGHDVHRAARVAAAGHGGQVLLSEPATDALAGRVPDDLGIRPLGAHRLKDLQPEQIAQLVVPGLPADYPPIRSLDARPNNLPTQLTSFVGRERELAEAAALVERSRLLTLTGPGGTGKTRLSLQLAASVADGFPDGLWWVPLAAVRDPLLIVPTIIRTVGATENIDRAPIDQLADALAGRRVLIVLDNLEQLPGAAPIIANVLKALPKLHILATSRSPLRISGEQEYPLTGLPAPIAIERLGLMEREQLTASERLQDASSLGGYEAVTLFVTRGAAVRPGFELTDGNAPDVSAIVARLDGIPLAIELAAARLRHLTPAAIHDRLDRRLDLLSSGAMDVPERQRTLRGAIEWSHELLDERHRRLLERLAVFTGGFDLECAERVAGGSQDPGLDLLDGLATLADQSLVRTGDADGEPRFSLLEPIREFALECLEHSGEAERLRERHAGTFLALAARLEPLLAGDEQRRWLDKLELEHDNIRAALDWSEGAEKPEIALALAAHSWRFWQKRGHLREARRRLDRLLAQPWAAAPTPLRADALEAAGGVAYWHGDFEGARPPYEEALEIRRATGSTADVANALYNLSFCFTIGGTATAENRRHALALLAEALELYRGTGDPRGTANALWGIGIHHYFLNENAEAVEPFEEALRLYRQVGDRTQEAWAMRQLGSALFKLGDLERARRLLLDSLRLFDSAGDVAGVTMMFDRLSWVAAIDGDRVKAGRLHGLARRLQQSSGADLARFVEESFEEGSKASVREVLPPAELTRYAAQGAAMTLQEGVRYALSEGTAPAGETAPAEGSAAAEGNRGGRARGSDVSLPAGTVTFLFTDIEGSTKLVAAVGDAAYGEILATERSLVLDAALAEGGVPFGSEGDAHFVAFGSASAAIRASIAALRALAAHPWPSGPVRVRMGVHTGEAQVVGEDYVGLEVHRAARVAAAAHGGQLLITDATRALAPDLPHDIRIRDLGEHRLKDLTRPEHLFQVAAAGLADDFPPLRTLNATPNNLPPQLTSFVGRAELADASALLDRSRLLTLTGPGGTGKTRLSLALAGDCVDRFPDGAWFVPLAAISDPDLIASAIASSVGLLAPGQPPFERVIEHFRDRTALLVLDNFEQVVAGAPLVGELLRAAPRLTVIASSRAPLRVSGEQEFPVPPLSLPPAESSDLDVLMASEAVRLFVERAMAVRPDFRLTPANGRHVAQIVTALDGLPLAIELAAARIRLLSPAAMATRLGDRLALLGSGGRDLPERQRTLRGAIAWSHDLLDQGERRLFARLGVFAGGGAIELAEAVCALDDDDPPDDVLAGLERLAEQSLIRIGDDAHADVRFSMLETIREFALERLDERGEQDVVRARHAAAFLALVSEAAGDGGAGDRARWLDRLEDDHDNLRAAIDHLVGSGDREGASAFVYAAWRFWQMRGHLNEGRSRVGRVLAMPGWADDPSIAHLHALEAAGGLAYWGGDMRSANARYAEAETLARRLGDQAELANALYNHFFAGRPSSSTEEWIAALADDSRPFLTEALEIWTRIGDDDGRAKGLWALAEHHAYRRETAQAETAATEALALFERKGDSFWVGWSRFTRAFARTLGGDPAGAGADLGAALREFQRARDVSGLVLCLSALPSALLLAHREQEAYRIAGAARQASAETGVLLAGLWPTGTFGTADPDTADAALQAALAEGAGWTREIAMETAIKLADSLAAGPSATS